MSNPKIEILVVSHKKSFVPANNLLKPIQVGSALAARLEGMAYYDNQEDNISAKNRSYCELTAVYWAWKNLDADYYGLFHYRRYLSFSDTQAKDSLAGKAYQDIPSALSEIDLDEQKMRSLIEEYDLIIPRKDEAQTMQGKSIYEQYRHDHNIQDLEYCIEYISKKYPHIAPFSDAVHSTRAYFCNMFIMKKEVFKDYCEFMFNVLESFEENNDISGYNVQQYRVTGYLAERLTNIYIQYLQSLGTLKIKELQIAFFENTDPPIEIKPIAGKNNIGIALAADNFYVPYISTLIRSLAGHASPKYIYDINIFHQDITTQNRELLKNEFSEFENLSIRFCDMSSRAGEYKKLMIKWHFTVETYFRLFIQDVMKDYSKVLYLDGDMIIKADVAELYNEQIDGFILGAVRDIDMAGVYNSNTIPADNVIDPKRKDYIDNELKIKDPYGYFQAGVLLLNLDEMRKSFTTKKALEFAASRHWEYQDQDVLNYLAQRKVKYLDTRWNVLYDWEFRRIKNVISRAPINMYMDYIESRKSPKIIHYGGTIKPWQRADCDFGDEYWKIARESAYYELILGRMAEWRVKNHGTTVSAVKPRLSSRAARKLRIVADRVAPNGTVRRRPITSTSKAIKKLIR